jgi:hypothetical protein
MALPLGVRFKCEALSSGLIASMAFRAASISAAISIFSAPGGLPASPTGYGHGGNPHSHIHAYRARARLSDLMIYGPRRGRYNGLRPLTFTFRVTASTIFFQLIRFFADPLVST